MIAIAPSAEVEQSLRLERDAVEAQIARYRLWLFGTILVTGPVMPLVAWLTGQSFPSNIAPHIGALVMFAYAWAWQRLVRRVGARPGLILLSLTLDMVGLLGPAWTVSGPEFAAVSTLLVPPSILLVLAVNLLRMSRAAAIAGGVVALVIGIPTLVHTIGPQPAVAGVAIATIVMSALAVAAADRSRVALETFARLSLLRRFLPPAAVERVLRDAPDTALALGGRTQTVTLIAADLRGFTRMSEKLSPVEVVRQLNHYHGAMLEVIERHGGAVDKFMGDGTLAVFGLTPLADGPGDAAASASVACARDMLDALAGLNEQRAGEGLGPLQIGIGVHTGPVVAGNIGAPGRRLEFTVIGDTVNTTARLEGLTKDAKVQVLMSQATVLRLPSRQGLVELPPLAVRGRDEPIVAFTFDGTASTAA